MKKNKENKAAVICIAIACVTIIASLILIFTTDSPKIIKNNNDLFREGLSGLVSNHDALKAIADNFELGPEKSRILVEHYKKMFDKTVIDYYMQRLEAYGVFRQGADSGTILSLIFRMSSELSAQGLSRVSKKDRAAYFNYVRHQIEVLSPKSCKLYLNGDKRLYSESEIQESNRVVLSLLSADEFEAYLSATRNAIHAQINGYPQKVILSDEQKKEAREVYLKALKDIFDKMDIENRERLSLASELKENANAADLCDYGRAIYEAAYNISNEDEKDLVILMLLRITQY